MESIEERFWLKVDKNGPVPAHRPDLGPCWLWLACIDTGGYGLFGVGSRTDGTRRLRKSHIVAWELAHGPIPPGLVTDHLCRVRNCVNPAHLEPVTNVENLRRGVGVGVAGAAAMRAKTHCPQGHPYAGDNLYVHPAGGRNCRACVLESGRRWRARRRIARENEDHLGFL